MDSIQCIESSSVIMSTNNSSNNTTEKHVVVFNINEVSRQQFLQKKKKSSLKSTRTRNNSNISTSDEMKKSIGSNDISVDDVVESNNNDNSNKSVRFSIVEVRDYSLCLGDNPSVSRGVPISLDWDYDTEHSHEFEVYESCRIVDRRNNNEMIRSSLQRIQLLKGLGYSRGEINEQAKSVHRIKEQRLISRRRAERTERMKRFFNRVVHCFPSSNKKKIHHRLASGDDEDETLASSTSSTKSGMIIATEIDL